MAAAPERHDDEGMLRRLFRPDEPALRPLDARESALLLAVFLAAVLFWSFGSLATELLLGDSLLSPHHPRPSQSFVDALWHVATAAILTIPARHRWLTVLAPALALGLDIDHLFGTVFPTVIIRSAHDLFFLAALMAIGYAVRGRVAMLAPAGAVLAHLAVDGGGFPFFGPFSTMFYPLSEPMQVGTLLLAGLLLYASVRPIDRLREPREATVFVATLAALTLLLLLAWPSIDPYTHG